MSTVPTLALKMGTRDAIERRESQLWWLAVLVIVLLALALFVIDMTNSASMGWFSPQLELALNTRLMRASLLIATLLICAYFRDNVRRLRRENAELISSLADYSRQLEKKNHEVWRLKELSDELISLADLRSALDQILGMAFEAIGADTASVMLREKDSDILRIIVSRGLPEDVVQSTQIHVGEAIAGLVAQEGKAVILNSDDLTGELAHRALRGDSIVSSVVVPIHLEGEVRGVVSVAKRRGGERFTDEDLGVLSTLANQAALAIQKIELLDSLKDQITMLAATVQELRQAQAELMQSEKLASIGQLAGGVAHEINNPLQVILGRAEILRMHENDESKAQALDCVLEHTSRIADIVSNLLCFSRRDSGTEFSPLDPNTILNKTLTLLEPQMAPDDITVERKLADKLPPVRGNSGQLQQVLTNLVLNAYHAMRDKGGTLKVSTRTRAGIVEIEIADTGPGIPPEYLGRLMEPFFTTKPEGEGTGLGLSIAYGIVQAHGGDIQVKSKPGKGACFTIALPIDDSISHDKDDASLAGAATGPVQMTQDIDRRAA